jgi:hypothetical protein
MSHRLIKYAHDAIHHPRFVKNRDKLAALIKRANITRAEAAQHIADETKRPCSWRTVQAWLAEPELASSRACPDWAIKVLTERLKAAGVIQ